MKRGPVRFRQAWKIMIHVHEQRRLRTRRVLHCNSLEVAKQNALKRSSTPLQSLQTSMKLLLQIALYNRRMNACIGVWGRGGGGGGCSPLEVFTWPFSGKPPPPPPQVTMGQNHFLGNQWKNIQVTGKRPLPPPPNRNWSHVHMNPCKVLYFRSAHLWNKKKKCNPEFILFSLFS